MTEFSFQDHQFMARAISLAKQGRFTTTPNPNVGCIIVKDDKIIAQGWHKKAGFGHAEVNALATLSQSQSNGATAYVTLEPCSHQGRTGACADALINAGIARVVIANLDPNPLVAGNGIKKLQLANIDVACGLLASEARKLNDGFLTAMEKQRPFIQVKLASSIDGKVALANGESKWITQAPARADVQTYRALSCAIVSTATTVIRDNAQLSVRPNELNFDYPIDEQNTKVRQPVKIILDGKDKITPSLLSQLKIAGSEKLVLVKSSQYKGDFNQFDNVMVLNLQYESGFDLKQLISWCYQQQYRRLWVEAGATLAGQFVEQGLVDELITYQGPIIMGNDALAMLTLGPYTKMNEITKLNLVDKVFVGDDVKSIYQLSKNEE